MTSNQHVQRPHSGGTTLIGAFLLMGVLAAVFAMVGQIQRNEIRESIRSIDEIVAATIVVCALAGSVVAGVLGNRHRGGIWYTTVFAGIGFVAGAFVGGAMWSKPPLTPVLTGCGLITVYAAVIRLRRGPDRLPVEPSDLIIAELVE